MSEEPTGTGVRELGRGPESVHPEPAVLAAFAAGAAGSAAARQVVRHLLRGCRSCSQVIREQLPLPAVEDYDAVLDRAFAAFRPEEAERPRARDRVEPVLAAVAELAGLPPLEQCRRLLGTARDLRRGDPRWIGILCAFGLAVCEPLAGERAHDLRAALWAELASARRMAGDLAGAEAAFTEAHRRFAVGGGDRGLYAEVLELHGWLLHERGDASGAAAMFGQAQSLFARRSAPGAAGRALVARGIALAAAGERSAAAGALLGGLELVALETDRAAAVEGLLHLALLLVAVKRPDLARPVARMARRLRRAERAGDPPRQRWLEGEVAAALGEYLPAARAFGEARAGFEAAARPYEALLVALRAAELELGCGRRSRAEAHLAEALLLSAAARLAPPGRAALASLADALRRGRADAALVRATAGEVRRAGTRSGRGAAVHEI